MAYRFLLPLQAMNPYTQQASCLILKIMVKIKSYTHPQPLIYGIAEKIKASYLTFKVAKRHTCSHPLQPNVADADTKCLIAPAFVTLTVADRTLASAIQTSCTTFAALSIIRHSADTRALRMDSVSAA